jgi:uncharacterized protein
MKALHQDAASEVRRLHVLHAARLQCARGCSSCCVDTLSVFEVEAELIRSVHGSLLADGLPHGQGACAFLSDLGACRIYEERPYVCRTQGLPLRWVADDEELRDICPLNEVADPEQALELIAPADCWTLGPFEEKMAQLELSQAISRPRVMLRALFAHKSA